MIMMIPTSQLVHRITCSGIVHASDLVSAMACVESTARASTTPAVAGSDAQVLHCVRGHAQLLRRFLAIAT